MSRLDLLDLSAALLADGVRSGAHPRDAALTASLAAATRLEAADIHAFVQLHPSAGAAADAARDASSDDAPGVSARNGALAGVPVAIKDNLADLALRTTCGSKMLAGYVSPYEATAVARLLDAGAIVIGKTNMDEFAMGSSTEHSAYGPTRNPIDPVTCPGRLVRWVGGSRRCGRRSDRVGLRDGRVRPPTRGVLRRCWRQAHLRAREPLRARRLRVVARSGRRIRPHGGRRGARDGDHQRSRPARRNECRYSGPVASVWRRRHPHDAR